ncbi:MAG: 2-phosphosulfolactate phosphatase [Desulfovibrionaceae bacterium]|nr:2-phosphosulfolactate phosphatase [Desulfovibrionaceae bacterium]
MRVDLLERLEGARRASGLVVAIDVFRAFSTACYVAAAGAARILAVDSPDRAREIKTAHPDWLLAGEVEGQRPADFELGNSPSEVLAADLAGRTVILRTDSGTPGLAACGRADELITGSFVNAAAVAAYLRSSNPDLATLVALGAGERTRAQEDVMCGMFIKNELEGYPNSFEALKRFFRGLDGAAGFFDPDNAQFPEPDFELCLDMDRFGFVLRASEAAGNGLWLDRVEVSGSAPGPVTS